MRKKMDAGAIYDKMVREGGPQTMTREAFIGECKRLSDPHLAQRDLSRMTLECDRQRMLGLYAKSEIDRVTEN